jgi:hydrogenase maturation protein HypF
LELCLLYMSGIQMASEHIDSSGRYRIDFSGVVQGVSFRPFVKRVADRLGVRGVAYNNTSGAAVEINVENEAAALGFAGLIRNEAPPAARIALCSIAAIEARPPE